MATTGATSSEEQAAIRGLIEQTRQIAPDALVNYICKSDDPKEPGILIVFTEHHLSPLEPNALRLEQLFDQYSSKSSTPFGYSLQGMPAKCTTLDSSFLPEEFIAPHYGRAVLQINSSIFQKPRSLLVRFFSHPESRSIIFLVLLALIWFSNSHKNQLEQKAFASRHHHALNELHAASNQLRSQNNSDQADRIDRALQDLESDKNH